MIVQNLVALLGFKTDQTSLRGAESALNHIKSIGVALVGVFSAVAIKSFVTGAIDSTVKIADSIDKMSLRTGLARGELQELGYAAQLAGTDLGQIEIATKTLSRHMFELQQSTSSATSSTGKIFQRLGISVTTADGNLRTMSDMIPEIADRLSNMKSDTERAAVALEIFGRSGTSMIPMLMKGGDVLRAEMAEARAFGAVLDDELIASLVRYQDNTERLGFVYQGFKNSLTKGLLPLLERLQTKWIEWIKTNREWIGLKIESVFSKLGQLIESLSSFMSRLISTVVELAKHFDFLPSKIIKIGALVAGIAAILMLPGGSLILLIGLVGLLIDDFETWRKGGQSLIGELLNGFEKLTGLNLEAFFGGMWKVISDGIGDVVRRIANFVLMIEEIGSMGFSKAIMRANIRETDLLNERLSHGANFSKTLGGVPSFSKDILATAQARSTVAQGFEYLYGNLREGQSIMPTTGSRSASTTINNNPTNTVNVVVNTTPGMDSVDVGNAVRDKISEYFNDELRFAAQSLLPGASE